MQSPDRVSRNLSNRYVRCPPTRLVKCDEQVRESQSRTILAPRSAPDTSPFSKRLPHPITLDGFRSSGGLRNHPHQTLRVTLRTQIVTGRSRPWTSAGFDAMRRSSASVERPAGMRKPAHRGAARRHNEQLARTTDRPGPAPGWAPWCPGACCSTCWPPATAPGADAAMELLYQWLVAG